MTVCHALCITSCHIVQSLQAQHFLMRILEFNSRGADLVVPSFLFQSNAVELFYKPFTQVI